MNFRIQPIGTGHKNKRMSVYIEKDVLHTSRVQGHDFQNCLKNTLKQVLLKMEK